MHKPFISSVLCVAIAAYGPLGCGNSKYSSMFGHRGSPSGPDSEPAQARGHSNANDQYLAELRQVELNIRSNPQHVPDGYGAVIQSNPNRNEAKISYARSLVAYSDQNGRLYIDPHRGQAAVSLMDQVLQTEKPTSELLYLHARCLELQQFVNSVSRVPRTVRADLDRARELDPANVDVQVEDAKLTILTAAGDHAKEHMANGEAQLRQVLSVAPNNAEIHYLLGVVAQTRSDFPAANAEYARALAIKPNHVDSLAAAAMNDYLNNQLPAFRSKVGRIAQLTGNTHSMVYFRTAVDYLGQGNRRAAGKSLETAELYDPTNRVYPAMMAKINQEQESVNDQEKLWLCGLIAMTFLVGGTSNPASSGSDFSGVYDAQGFRLNYNGARMDPDPVAPGSAFP